MNAGSIAIREVAFGCQIYRHCDDNNRNDNDNSNSYALYVVHLCCVHCINNLEQVCVQALTLLLKIVF